MFMKPEDEFEIITYVDEKTLKKLEKLAEKEGFQSADECADYIFHKQTFVLCCNDPDCRKDLIEKVFAKSILSRTDLAVYSRYQTGQSIKDIAEELGLSEKEVKDCIGYARLQFPSETRRPFP